MSAMQSEHKTLPPEHRTRQSTDIADTEKARAAEKALAFVKDDMTLGLGTGSTAEIFLTRLAEKIKSERLTMRGVATSLRTRKFCEDLEIPLTDFDAVTKIDLCIDGADEFDGEFRLIKGGGGALLREKITAQAADKMIVIADSSKKKDILGDFPLPVEIFAWAKNTALAHINALFDTYRYDKQGTERPTLRLKPDGKPFISDSGNYIIDMPLKKIEQTEKLSRDLHKIAGVAEHGLFLQEADCVIYGSDTLVKTTFY